MATKLESRFMFVPHGIILRAAAKALGVSQPGKPSRATASRYLAGKWTDPDTSFVVVTELVDNLARELLWPEAPRLEKALVSSGADPGPVVPLSIMSVGVRWDRTQAIARDGAGDRPIPPAIALPPLLRLAFVDLALREAAALHLLGGPEPVSTLPEWADPARRDRPALLLRSALLGRSQAEMAKVLGIKIDTLKRWLGGERPLLALPAVAARISAELGMSTAEATTWLARFYGFRKLRDLLASEISAEVATGLLSGWRQLTASFWQTLKFVRASPGKERLVLGQMVLYGADGKPGKAVLQSSARLAPAPEWAGAIRGAADPVTYLPQLFDTLAVLASPLAAASREGTAARRPNNFLLALAKRFEDPAPLEPAPTERRRTPSELASALQTVASHHHLHGRHRELVDVLKQCVELVPADASVRLALARGYEVLGQFDKAVEECLVAAATPWLQVQATKALGDVFLHQGTPQANAEALRVLESIEASVSADPHYYYSLGLARMRAGQHREAAKTFRRVLALASHHERAKEALANCLHLLGEYVDGATLTKQSLRRGHVAVYLRMRNGLYQKRRRRTSS